MISKKDIVVVILAGGKSQRMGTNKAFLEWNGKLFIEYIIKAAQGLEAEVILIANEERYRQFEIPIYADIIPNKGPLGGMYTAMKKVSKKYYLILSCDIPCIRTELLRFLIEKSKECLATVLSLEGQVQPLVGLYSQDVLINIKEALANKNLKLKLLLETINATKIDCPPRFKKDLTNINKPEDINLL